MHTFARFGPCITALVVRRSVTVWSTFNSSIPVSISIHSVSTMCSPLLASTTLATISRCIIPKDSYQVDNIWLNCKISIEWRSVLTVWILNLQYSSSKHNNCWLLTFSLVGQIISQLMSNFNRKQPLETNSKLFYQDYQTFTIHLYRYTKCYNSTALQ